MPIGDNSKVALTLDNILSQTKLSRNEICCKLRELIEIMGGGSATGTLPGTVLLTSGGTDTFDIGAPLQGTSYNSVSYSVLSLTSGTVTITDATGDTDVSYVGLSSGWTGIIGGTLVITVAGDAVVLVTYTAI